MIGWLVVLGAGLWVAAVSGVVEPEALVVLGAVGIVAGLVLRAEDPGVMGGLAVFGGGCVAMMAVAAGMVPVLAAAVGVLLLVVGLVMMWRG